MQKLTAPQDWQKVWLDLINSGQTSPIIVNLKDGSVIKCVPVGTRFGIGSSTDLEMYNTATQVNELHSTEAISEMTI